MGEKNPKNSNKYFSIAIFGQSRLLVGRVGMACILEAYSWSKQPPPSAMWRATPDLSIGIKYILCFLPTIRIANIHSKQSDIT